MILQEHPGSVRLLDSFLTLVTGRNTHTFPKVDKTVASSEEMVLFVLQGEASGR